MSNIEVITRETELTLEIRAQVTMPKMPKLIKNSYESILEVMKKENIPVTKAPFVKYEKLNWEELNTQNKLIAFFKMFTQKWDVVIGFPVDREVENQGNIKCGKIEGGKFIMGMHLGPYMKVGKTYEKMLKFMKENNLQPKPESIEYYLNDPKKVKKSELETMVLIPISEEYLFAGRV